MADQAINALSTKTAPETSDQLLLVGTGEPQLIDYDKLADAILNKITSKNYALDAGQMTLLAALNKLNSDTLKANTINHKSFDLNDYTVTGLYDTRGTLPSTIGMKNYPTNITASIIVLSTTYIVTQIYIAHNAASLYLRCKYQGHEFSEWKSVQLI